MFQANFLLSFHIPSILKKPPKLVNRRLTARTLHNSIYPLQLDQSVSSLRTISSDPFFFLLSLCKNTDSLRKIHAFLTVHGICGELPFDTKLISLYGLFGHVKTSRLLFDGIGTPDMYSWKVMIRCYFLNDKYVEIIRFYNRRGFLLVDDNVVFSIVLKACSELGDIDEGRKIHCQIFKVGNPDSFVFSGLVDMYAKCGGIGFARRVFDEIGDRNVVSWTSMIAGYVQNDLLEEGLVLFNKMRMEMVEVNHFTLGSLVTACAKLGSLHQGRWAHGCVIKSGIELNPFLVTSLLDMYAKNGTINDASLVFNEFNGTDVVAWTAMIVGFGQSGYCCEALKLFTDKKWAGLSPNSITLASVFSACAHSSNLRLGESVHGMLIKIRMEDATVNNALLGMYAKFDMMIGAHHIFLKMSTRDVVSWNTYISGFYQNGFPYVSLQLFNEMRLWDFQPDSATVVAVLAACSSIDALDLGPTFHAYALKDGLLLSSVHVCTSLLHLYAKCGDTKAAQAIFNGMEEKSEVTWSAMIGGYGVGGSGDHLVDLFSNMLKENLVPNEVIFVNILAACSRAGMVGEGWWYFNLMCREFNFVPSMKHYVCMVDLLARSGRLGDALDFIDKMPVVPDVSVFGAYLHGCRLHSRFDLGEFAIERMLELHPEEACYYVLASNLYASDGRWGEVSQVRKLMKKRGLSKLPGSSARDMDLHDERASKKAPSFG